MNLCLGLSCCWLSLRFDVDYEVVGGEEPHEELDLKDLSHWKLLRNRLFPSFIVLNKRSIRLTECLWIEAKGFRASGYHPVDKDNWLVVYVSNTQEGFNVDSFSMKLCCQQLTCVNIYCSQT